MTIKSKYNKVAEEIKATREELDQRQQLLMQYDREINQKIMDYQADKHAEIRRQVEQSIDFALRSLPWYRRLSLQAVVNKTNRYFEAIKDVVMAKSVQAMAEEMKKNGVDLYGDADPKVDVENLPKEAQDGLNALADRVDQQAVNALENRGTYPGAKVYAPEFNAFTAEDERD